MGVKFGLVGFPLLLMIALILMTPPATGNTLGSVAGSGDVCFNNANQNQETCASVAPAGTGFTLTSCAAWSPAGGWNYRVIAYWYQCTDSSDTFQYVGVLASGVNPNYNAQLYPPGQPGTGSPAYANCVFSAAPTITCTLTQYYEPSRGTSPTGNGMFAFTGSVGADNFGYILVIVGIIAVALIASFNFLGSGVNSEGTHIIFEAGGLIALWVILSAIEGFLTVGTASNPNEFFNSLNAALFPVGTILFMVITLVYSVGVFSAVSRGV